MPWFRCLARGENFLLQEDGVLKLFGFYTTRWVEAANAKEAEFAALAILKADERFEDMPRDQRNKEAKVFFEEIAQCNLKPKFTGGGFTFFEMSNADESGHHAEALDIETTASKNK